MGPTVTAWANVNVALVKYWGRRDAALSLPATGSLSVTLDGLGVEARVAFGTPGGDSYEIDGAPASGEERERLAAFLARKWGIYDGKNSMDSVQMTKVDNQVTEFLTDEELSRLLEVLENWPFRERAACVRFAMLTGVSCGELFKLQWDHIDFEQRMVKLIDPRGNRTATIPVSPQALDVLAALNRDSVYVFPGDDGKQRTDFKEPWLRIRKAAGLPPGFRFHVLRHHFASTLVSNGVDLSIVGALLTHKNISTTQRYAHLWPDVVKEAATQAGKLLQPKKRKASAKFVKK